MYLLVGREEGNFESTLAFAHNWHMYIKPTNTRHKHKPGFTFCLFATAAAADCYWLAERATATAIKQHN
jgi:hypothetical protein